MYSELKLFHISCALISLSLFALRAYWMWKDSLGSRPSWIKRLPHFVDTLLLVSGLGLIKLTGFTPFNSSWLALKICLLLAYILSGALALHYGRRQGSRILWLVIAIGCASGIVSLAYFKPMLW